MLKEIVYIIFFFFFLGYGVHLFCVANVNFEAGFKDIFHLMHFYSIEVGALLCWYFAYRVFDGFVKRED